MPVQIRGILPANSGVAIFIGNTEKVFVIQVERAMGSIIGMALGGTPKDRPLTHDLIRNIFQGFGISVERVVITELRNATYYARLILQQSNELGRKIVELDARPSDCLAIAAANRRPIFVAATLFKEVEDMTEVLERLSLEPEEPEDSDDDDDDDEEEGEDEDNDDDAPEDESPGGDFPGGKF